MKFNFQRFLIVILAATFIFAACGPVETEEDKSYRYENQLADTGLFGQHKLESLKASEGLSGTFSARYFLFGSAEGELSNTVSLRFKWSPLPDEYIISSVDQSKFRTKIVDTLEEPVIEFEFNENWLTSHHLPSGSLEWGPMNKTEKANLNDFVQSEYLVLVRVYISTEDRANEPNLP